MIRFELMQLKQIILGLALISVPVGAQAAWRPHRGGPHEPPPAVVVETPRSRPGHVWVGGHHEWRHGHYVWVGGRLVRERRGYDWDDGRWEHHEDHWDYHNGGWRAHR